MSIEVRMFETPSGNIRGLAHVDFGKHTLVNATLFTDKPAELSSKRLPTRLTSGELLEIADLLAEFARRVAELDE